MMKKTWFATLFLAALMIGQMPGAWASFPEKDITFVIPYGPGGGFDQYVRAMAPVMEKYLPNKVNVVPKNMGGAGGRKGGDYVARAQADGYTIAIFNFPGIALAQIKGEAKFDLKKLTWLAEIGTDRYGLTVGGKSKFKSVQDLQTAGRNIKFTSTGKSTTAHVVTVITTTSLNITPEIITGYKSSKDSILGAIRGDGDATMMVMGTLDKYLKSGDLKLIASLTEDKPYPDVPNAKDLGFPDLANLGISRMVGGPPELPSNIKNILADALAKTMNDPGLLAWSKKAKRPITPRDATNAQKEVLNQLKFFEKYSNLF